MNFADYQEAAARTWGNQMPTDLTDKMREQGVDRDTIHGVKRLGTRLSLGVLGLGITGEAGEVADEIKKYVGHGHWKDGFDMMKELGDVLWYIAVLCQALDLNMGEVAEKNIAKLRARYPEGFSTEASQARLDVSEPKDPEHIERPKPISEQVLDLIEAKWEITDRRTTNAFLLRAQQANCVRFAASGPLYSFLRKMKDSGAHILPADEPAVPCKGWSVWWPDYDDRMGLNAVITISDMKNSSDPRNSPSAEQWADLLIPPPPPPDPEWDNDFPDRE